MTRPSNWGAVLPFQNFVFIGCSCTYDKLLFCTTDNDEISKFSNCLNYDIFTLACKN